MNIIYKEKKQKILEELIKLVIIVVLYLISNGLFTDKDISRKIIDTMGIIIPIIVYILMLVFSDIITKPIIMDLGINNFKLRDKHSTDIYHHNTDREDQRTIVVSIQLCDKGTAWAKLARYKYRNSKIKVDLNIQPPEDTLLIQPTTICERVEERFLDDGKSVFSIDITDIILSRLVYDIPIKKEYKFIINENNDNLPQNDEEYCIKPKVLINNKQLGFLDKRFIKINNTLVKGYYQIYYIK